MSSSSILCAYDNFLAAHTDVQDAIGLAPGEQSQLRQLLQELMTQGKLPPFVVPPGGRLSENDLRAIHLRHAAWALYVELNHRVPWSLASYTPAQLKQLLGYDALKTAPGFVAAWVAELGTGSLPPTPPWLRGNQHDTLIAMGEWVRTHIQHLTEGQPDPASYAAALKGGEIGSCHNTGDLMDVSALALNIPAKTEVKSDGHRYIDFPAQGLALLHNDDLYSRDVLKAPVSAIFVSGSDRTAYLDAVAHNPTQAQRMMWLLPLRPKFQYPDDELLTAACGGRQAVLSKLYSDGMCYGNCPKLSDYAPDVEKVVDQNLAALSDKAKTEHRCAARSQHN